MIVMMEVEVGVFVCFLLLGHAGFGFMGEGRSCGDDVMPRRWRCAPLIDRYPQHQRGRIGVVEEPGSNYVFGTAIYTRGVS